MDDRSLFKDYYYDPRKLASSVESELRNALQSSGVLITIGIVKKYAPDKGLYEVQLISGPSIKAISILEDPVRGIFHGLQEGDRVYVLVVPGSGGIILKKLYPVLDDYEREDMERALDSAVSHFLRNGAFFNMKEDETAEVSLGNPAGLIKLTASLLHVSHDAFVLVDSTNTEMRLGLMRRGSEVGKLAEYYLAVGEGKLALGEQYIGGVSVHQPETDSELGTLLGLLEHTSQGVYLYTNGVKLKSPSYVFIEYPTTKLKVKGSANNVSIDVVVAGKTLTFSLSPSVSGFDVHVEYNSKSITISLNDTPTSGVDMSSGQPIMSSVSIQGGASAGSTTIALSDKVLLGMKQGASMSKVAYAGGMVSIPVGPTPPTGLGLVETQKSLAGIHNMLELMKLTTPAGPIIPSGTVEFKSVIVDGSSSSLVEI